MVIGRRTARTARAVRVDLIIFRIRQYLQFVEEVPIFESVVFWSDLYFLLVMDMFVPWGLQQEREKESAEIE